MYSVSDKVIPFEDRGLSNGEGASVGNKIKTPPTTEMLLVVEDEVELLDLAVAFLEAEGYTVLRAMNGLDALRVFREHAGEPIELVITDVIMPQMDGKVMAEWLRTIQPELKILFTSGYNDNEIAEHGVLVTGVEYLPKPYRSSTLTRKVRDMLHGHDNSKISDCAPTLQSR